jgi:hypothetical protein
MPYVGFMNDDRAESTVAKIENDPSGRTRIRDLWSRWVIWIYRRVPPGARTLLGVLVLIGGVLGFLPVLGFWMIPLGLVIISLDFRPLIRARRRRMRSA